MEGNKKRTLAEIDAEIKATKEALNNVHGKETEVYARIVGYYRAVRNWNKGKADEFKQRKMFTIEASEQHIDSFSTQKAQDVQASSDAKTAPASGELHYEFFFRQTCPNCPPVKAFVSELDVAGEKIDVDTKDGLAKAAAKGVFAAPTVIVYNSKNEEVARAHNVDELAEVFNPVAQIAV
ncbi:MAG: anaerobic ribonucleoside-triphosphate reductase [Treponema sp.]|nr:anaerobic ribonucleoside-triphosphate reductase [Treponema sp.]MDY5682000.1 anaerobic ribonucleoside-triphosphate reductase [Treponema sp.]